MPNLFRQMLEKSKLAKPFPAKLSCYTIYTSFNSVFDEWYAKSLSFVFELFIISVLHKGYIWKAYAQPQAIAWVNL